MVFLHKYRKFNSLYLKLTFWKACTLSSTGIAKLLLKSVEDKLGEAGLRDFLEQEDIARNTALMVCVESGAGESAVTLLGAG